MTREVRNPLEAPLQIHRIAVGGAPALKARVHNNLDSSFCECLIECSVFMCMFVGKKTIGKAFVTGTTRRHD